MIISVEEVKEYITTTVKDSVLEAKLQALEVLIRKRTNNNFHKVAFRTAGTFEGGKLYCDTAIFKVGETIQVTQSEFNEGLYVISEIDGDVITIEGSMDEADVLVTKVEYPADVKMGVVEMLDWKLKNADKAGVQSETISRHSQTFDRASIDKDFGVPKELTGFLKGYMKARF